MPDTLLSLGKYWLDPEIDVETNVQFCPELTLCIATHFTKSISFVKPVVQFYHLRPEPQKPLDKILQVELM